MSSNNEKDSSNNCKKICSFCATNNRRQDNGEKSKSESETCSYKIVEISHYWKSCAHKEYQKNKSKSRTNQSSEPLHLEYHLTIQLRNARERNRVRAVNEAFTRLRKMIPYTAHRNKRISKVKTLQKAVQYITELSELLKSQISN